MPKLGRIARRIILSTCYLYFISVSTAFANMEIRHIKPPNLSSAHLGKKIICQRPMRRGTPNLSIEMVRDKVIVNNYGHGGSGWTLAPGIADYVNNLLISSEHAANLNKTTPITIIGAGVIGLYTAYDLYQKGYKNITIVADKFRDLTSHNAGGLLAPVSMDNNAAMQKIINQIGIDSYKVFASIADRTNPHFKTGAKIMPFYFKDKESSGLEPYVGSVMQPPKEVLLDFGNGTMRQMIAYDDGIFIEVDVLMQSMTKYLKSKRIKFEKMKIKDFSEINSTYIFNCSGFGAKNLKNDANMVAVQGHLIMLKDQEPENLQYMILTYLYKHTTASGQNIIRSFYVSPKHIPGSPKNDVGVIGGTFVENASFATPNNEEFEIMLDNAREFYGLKKE